MIIFEMIFIVNNLSSHINILITCLLVLNTNISNLLLDFYERFQQANNKTYTIYKYIIY